MKKLFQCNQNYTILIGHEVGQQVTLGLALLALTDPVAH